MTAPAAYALTIIVGVGILLAIAVWVVIIWRPRNQ